MERGSLKPSERDILLENFVKEWRTEITNRPEKPPEEAYKERLDAAKEVLANSLETARSNLGGADKATRQTYLELIDESGRYVQEVEDEWEDSKDEEERKYQDFFTQKQKRMAFAFFDALGPSFLKELFRDWCQPSLSIEYGDNLQSDTTALRQATAGLAETALTQSGQTQARVQEAPKLDTPVSQDPDNEANNDTTFNDIQGDEPHEASPAIHQKRRASTAALATPHTEKRLRFLETDNLTGDRTIEFDEVFQGGNAAKKHIISEYDDKWYIVACEVDNKEFMKNALRGAARHLTHCKDPRSVGQHGHEGAIRALGTLVLNCDEEKANMNNMVARRPSYSDQGQPLSRMNSMAPSTKSRNVAQINHTGPLVDPKPGNVYKAYWEPDDSFYAVVILPWETFCFRKWAITLKGIGLLQDVPICYAYDPDMSIGTPDWMKDYKPGGPMFAERQYPVMYFDQPQFPTNCSSGWVSVDDLQEYDPTDVDMPYRDVVDDYLAVKRAGASNHGIVSSPIADDDTSRPATRESIQQFYLSGTTKDCGIEIPESDNEPDERFTVQRGQQDLFRIKCEASQSGLADLPDRQATNEPSYRPDIVASDLPGTSNNSGTVVQTKEVNNGLQAPELNGSTRRESSPTRDRVRQPSHASPKTSNPPTIGGSFTPINHCTSAYPSTDNYAWIARPMFNANTAAPH
ncbi:hypothetical protein FBEOM_1882 [Fusarium beomiforme]|uniref:Uncharacterized protein n=1 Tax=Fusarium beomiforme TaxID=44412 RepID=A0A9P5ASH5_9HYPO|nr:hypothetical protein FBEOM_1882 [Fusarium beomiforme]